MTLETISVEGLNNLYRLYVAVCERAGTRPTIRDFIVWLSEEGYIDED